MKTGKYTLREFFSNSDLSTIIIPEIQRDYVWGEDQISRILDSISEDYGKYTKSNPIECIENVSPEIIENFNQYYRKHYLSSNIGFIYAYSDADYPGYYFLIDGQQRFTTIFLMMIVMAAKGTDDDRINFRREYTHGETSVKPKVDYRVREASHNFLCQLVKSVDKAQTDLSGEWIKKQSWYLCDYENDTTIESMVNNIDVISKYLEDKHLLCSGFREYVEDYLEFWYFDTNISEQGEELYIYMNARGEFMQAHENLKADLIAKLIDSNQKKKYGKEWEKWQDLFWKNRGENPNADDGFNEFLSCIAGLENFKRQATDRLSYINSQEEIPYEYRKDILSMEVIEKYYNALENLFEESNIGKFKSSYSYHLWIDKAKQLFWDLFNNKKTNWFANFTDDNKGAERNRMVYVWSMFSYLTDKNLNKNEIENIYRTLRLFYIRYNNNDRAVDETLKNIPTIVNNGPWDSSVLKDEEQKKYSFLKGKDKDLEAWIWKIEDHPLNLDGSNVGNINCSHLVDFGVSPSVKNLEDIYNAFCELFPINNGKPAGNNKLLNSLLFTSLDNGQQVFWDINGPGYYTRLDFSSFKKIIRGKSNQGDNQVFRTFFSQYIGSGPFITKSQGDVETIISKNGKRKDDVNGNDTIIYALCWYAATKGDGIWEKGNFMSYNHRYENSNYQKDKNFPNITSLTNMKGDFKSSNGYQYLQDLN